MFWDDNAFLCHPAQRKIGKSSFFASIFVHEHKPLAIVGYSDYFSELIYLIRDVNVYLMDATVGYNWVEISRKVERNEAVCAKKAWGESLIKLRYIADLFVHVNIPMMRKRQDDCGFRLDLILRFGNILNKFLRVWKQWGLFCDLIVAFFFFIFV